MILYNVVSRFNFFFCSFFFTLLLKLFPAFFPNMAQRQYPYVIQQVKSAVQNREDLKRKYLRFM